jgi:hypothetical protein
MDLKTGETKQLDFTHWDSCNYIFDLASNPDGTVLAVRSKRRIELCDIDTLRVLLRIVPVGRTGPLAFRPDGQALAIATSHELEIWATYLE